MRDLYVLLVHYPVLGRSGEVLSSTITNLDIHDMARSAKTYAAKALVLVHPVLAQRQLAEKICEHWEAGAGGKRIPSRAQALSMVKTTESLEAFYESLGGRSSVEVWTTAAKAPPSKKLASYIEMKLVMQSEGKPVCLLFGTSWGLPESLLSEADVALEPISGRDPLGFNHLSVRAACAISLDRLLG